MMYHNILTRVPKNLKNSGLERYSSIYPEKTGLKSEKCDDLFIILRTLIKIIALHSTLQSINNCRLCLQMQTILYHNSSGHEAFTGNLKQKEVHRAITLHPVKQHSHMYRIHNYMKVWTDDSIEDGFNFFFFLSFLFCYNGFRFDQDFFLFCRCSFHFNQMIRILLLTNLI